MEICGWNEEASEEEMMIGDVRFDYLWSPGTLMEHARMYSALTHSEMPFCNPSPSPPPLSPLWNFSSSPQPLLSAWIFGLLRSPFLIFFFPLRLSIYQSSEIRQQEVAFSFAYLRSKSIPHLRICKIDLEIRLPLPSSGIEHPLRSHTIPIYTVKGRFSKEDMSDFYEEETELYEEDMSEFYEEDMSDYEEDMSEFYEEDMSELYEEDMSDYEEDMSEFSEEDMSEFSEEEEQDIGTLSDSTNINSERDNCQRDQNDSTSVERGVTVDAEDKLHPSGNSEDAAQKICEVVSDLCSAHPYIVEGWGEAYRCSKGSRREDGRNRCTDDRNLQKFLTAGRMKKPLQRKAKRYLISLEQIHAAVKAGVKLTDAAKDLGEAGYSHGRNLQKVLTAGRMKKWYQISVEHIHTSLKAGVKLTDAAKDLGDVRSNLFCEDNGNQYSSILDGHESLSASQEAHTKVDDMRDRVGDNSYHASRSGSMITAAGEEGMGKFSEEREHDVDCLNGSTNIISGRDHCDMFCTVDDGQFRNEIMTVSQNKQGIKSLDEDVMAEPDSHSGDIRGVAAKNNLHRLGNSQYAAQINCEAGDSDGRHMHTDDRNLQKAQTAGRMKKPLQRKAKRQQISLEHIHTSLKAGVKLTDAAKDQGVSRSTLKRRLREEGIKWQSTRKSKRHSVMKKCTESEPSQLQLGITFSGSDEQKLKFLDDSCQKTLRSPLPFDPELATSPVRSDKCYVINQALGPDTTAEGTVQATYSLKGRFTDCRSDAGQDVNSSMLRVKATYEDDTFRFDLSISSSFPQLVEELTKRIPIESGKFKIKYKDDEEDWISITCTEDLHQCLNLAKSCGSETVRLKIVIS